MSQDKKIKVCVLCKNKFETDDKTVTVCEDCNDESLESLRGSMVRRPQGSITNSKYDWK